MSGRRGISGAIWRTAIALAAIAAAFAVDQFTKVLAQTELAGGRVVDLIPGLRFELVYNPGVAFGLGGALSTPVVLGLMAVAAALIAWSIGTAVVGRRMTPAVLLALAGGGGAGNVWDRISRATGTPLNGEVVDFIALDSFAIFNVADIFTTGGIAGWALVTLLTRESRAPRPA